MKRTIFSLGIFILFVNPIFANPTFKVQERDENNEKKFLELLRDTMPSHLVKVSHMAQEFDYTDLNPELMKAVFDNAPVEFKSIVHSNTETNPQVNSVFLWGEPGTGKTTLGLAAAWFLKRPCIVLDPANASNRSSSCPENLSTVLIPLIESKNKPYVVIVDDVSPLINQNDNTMDNWKLIDQCLQASNIFFVFTTNDPNIYPKKMPRVAKDRFIGKCIEIVIPTIDQCKNILIDKLKKDPSVYVTPEIENYIRTHPNMAFNSFRELEAVITHILCFIDYENHSNVTKTTLTKELLDEALKKLENTNLISLNKNDCEDMKKHQLEIALAVARRNEQFQLLLQDRRQKFDAFMESLRRN